MCGVPAIVKQRTNLANQKLSLCGNSIFVQQIVPNQRIDWSIHEEPVHYEQYAAHRRCGTDALGSILKVNNTPVGHLGLRHGRIFSSHFSREVYDRRLSLYEGWAHSIVNRSLAIRQGDGEADFRCATIQLTEVDWEPGLVPCERVRYADCLVGTRREAVCVFRACEGYRVYWGRVPEGTLFCEQGVEKFPKAVGAVGRKEGVVECLHGFHTLLRPVIGTRSMSAGY